VIAAGGRRQRLQRLDLDDAAGPALAGRGAEHVVSRSTARWPGERLSSSTSIASWVVTVATNARRRDVLAGIEGATGHR
jgi:hypothetical protein